MTGQNALERVTLKGRKGLFLVVSVQDAIAHVLPLHGAAQVFSVALDEIELAPELQARTTPESDAPHN